ncbi:MAG TPA: DUF3187 family protein [Thermodesulfovibrionales bacterium]|nr:DUF3187 family protein [Thermodesulfovibrionales bacterium]
MLTRIIRTLIRALAVLTALLLLSSRAYPFEGPLYVKNQFPLFLLSDPPYLEKASLEDSFSSSFFYSSIYMVRNSSQWSVGLDMELAELDLRLRKAIHNTIELGIDIPFLSLNSGIMDSFLEDYHRTFGFSDYGRSSRPRNSFLYEVYKGSNLIFKTKGGNVGIGDIRVMAKKTVLTGDPVLSVRLDLELPSGSISDGFGNGTPDAGVALLLDKRLGEKIMTYTNGGVVFPGDLKWRERQNLREFVYGAFGVEAAIWNSFSLLGQVFVQGSPFPHTTIPQIDRTAVLLTFGGRYHSGRDNFEFSLTEDPNTAGAPDFTLSFSYKRYF